MGDVEVMMEFRNQHWDLWVDFVKNEIDYCNKTSEFKEYCNCSDCKGIKFCTEDGCKGVVVTYPAENLCPEITKCSECGCIIDEVEINGNK